LPNDVSVSNIFAGADGVIGEGVGAVNLNGTWIGSLTEVSQDGGYWVKTSSDISLDHSDAEPVNYDDDGEVVYDIHYGNNLISYSFSASQSIDDALGSAAANVYALAGQGVAALAINGNFVGSLTDFEGGNGYWIVASSDFSFSYAGVESGLTRTKESTLREVPKAYRFAQSDQQSFFFVNSATILGEELSSDDIVIAYKEDVIVGSRYWNGEYTDVPVMGISSDSDDKTANYCVEGDVITFKVLIASSGELVEMQPDTELTWNYMGMPIVNLTDTFPMEISLNNAYPNPFNPTTTLSFVVPAEMSVSLAIYDMRGRLVEELVNDMHQRGQYQVAWNADAFASGVYMVKLVTGSTVNIQKVMLVK
jgi:hypothetical protein